MVYQSQAWGFQAYDQGFFFGNVSWGNATWGILAGSTSGFRGNSVRDNGSGDVFEGLDMGGNICSGAVPCP